MAIKECASIWNWRGGRQAQTETGGIGSWIGISGYDCLPDEDRLKKAFEAGAEIGIPVVMWDRRETGVEKTAADHSPWRGCRFSSFYGVTLCVKAHVGASI